jgi:hypothetical protein
MTNLAINASRFGTTTGGGTGERHGEQCGGAAHRSELLSVCPRIDFT